MATTRVVGAEAPAVEGGEERLSRLLSWAALAGIVVLALWLRWDRLEFTEYTRDQAWVLNRAWEWLHGGEFPLVGIQSSVGTSQGAIEIWLLAIPVAISPDPRLAAAFVGLLQVLAIVGTYLLCATYFGRGVGLVAALLFAVNPWALQYSRKVWTPDVAPLFTVLFFSALYAAVVQRRRYWLALACLWAAVLFLIHPSAIYCFALLGVAALLFWRRLGWQPFVLGGALALAVALPFLWYEYQHQFQSVKIYLSLTGNQSRFDFDAVKNVLTMASAQAFPTMMGYSFTGEWSLPDQTLQNQLASWLLYLGLFWSLLFLVRPLVTRLTSGRWAAGGWERALLLLLWFALPILVALRHPLDYYPHYFINVLPVQYVLMALGLVSTLGLVARAVGRASWARWAVLVPVLAVALYLAGSQVLYFQTYLGYVQTQEPLGRYGIPYRYTQQAVDTARVLARERGLGYIYGYTSGQWDQLRYLARPEFEVREVDRREGLALPLDPGRGAVFLLADDSIGVSDRKPFTQAEDTTTLARLRDLGYVELPERAVRGPLGYTYYRFFTLAPAAGQATRQAFETGPRLALGNGMTLRGVGHLATGPGPRDYQLPVLWQVPQNTGANRQPEYNLLLTVQDARGATVAQVEWLVAQNQDRYQRDYLPPWQAEDLPVAYYTWPGGADAKLAPGDYRLLLSAQRRDDKSPVPWQNGQPELSVGTLDIH